MGCSRAPCPPATLVYAQLALVCAEHAHYNKITHCVTASTSKSAQPVQLLLLQPFAPHRLHTIVTAYSLPRNTSAMACWWMLCCGRMTRHHSMPHQQATVPLLLCIK